MVRCTVGVMAYNEEATISTLLYAMLAQQYDCCQVDAIVVVASGCTDRTVELAQAIAARHPLVRVLVEAERNGKAAAINLLRTHASGEVIVLVGADTLPDPTALEQLVMPFADPTVGMTGARVVPLNDPQTRLGFTVQLLWHVHHRLALRWPKLGELVAFRNIVPALPIDTATDEVALEALICAAGYRLVYAPKAVVYNYGPETLGDFIRQRRRIFAGHLSIAARYRYIAASMAPHKLALLGLSFLRRYPDLLPHIAAAALLECLARLLGTCDLLLQRRLFIWPVAHSTKTMPQREREMHLMLLQLRANSLCPSLLRLMSRIPATAGTLLWWDAHRDRATFLLPAKCQNEAALAAHAASLAGHIAGGKQHALLSYTLVRFAIPTDAVPVVDAWAPEPGTAVCG